MTHSSKQFPTVIHLLMDHGPQLSSDLIARYKTMGLSSAAARKRISRANGEIRSLSGLTFPKRARFLYLNSQFGEQGYWDALLNAVKNSSPAYRSALLGIESRGGIVPKNHFGIISGAPIRQSGQVASSTILQRLRSVGLLEVSAFDGVGECVHLNTDWEFFTPQLSVLRAQLTTENVLLGMIKSWAGRMNMASPDATTTRGDSTNPQFGTFQFDLCGPSYLNPLKQTKSSGLQPGFFVADIIVGRDLDLDGVTPFLRKCKMLNSIRTLPNFLPMLIADNFTPQALNKCRASGIIATRPETLFGKDVARALADLLHTLSNAAAISAVNPARIEKLFTQISAIEGAAANLRGALFELVVGHIVRAIEGGSIDIGIQVYSHCNSENAEIDVRLVRERDVIVYECKGYQPSSFVSKEEIHEWLTKKVPTIYKALRQETRFNGDIRFEFWTCGKFADDACALLENAKTSLRKYKIAWKKGSDIQEYVKRISAGGIRKILNEHYFKHPL